MNGTKMLNPLYSIAADRTIAFAQQVKDEAKDKMQSEINTDVDNRFAELTLTDEELDAIVNGVDMDEIYIIVVPTGSGSDVKAYHFDDDGTGVMCFSSVGGDKYYVSTSGIGSVTYDGTTNKFLGGDAVYSDKAMTTAIGTLSGDDGEKCAVISLSIDPNIGEGAK